MKLKHEFDSFKKNLNSNIRLELVSDSRSQLSELY